MAHAAARSGKWAQHFSNASCNKTANINDKNCSLSILLTAVDQKLQKS